MAEVTYSVPGMSCAHCERAVGRACSESRASTRSTSTSRRSWSSSRGGSLDDRALRAAIEDAGYEAA